MQGQCHEETHILYLLHLLTGTSNTQVVNPQYCNIAVAIIHEAAWCPWCSSTGFHPGCCYWECKTGRRWAHRFDMYHAVFCVPRIM